MDLNYMLKNIKKESLILVNNIKVNLSQFLILGSLKTDYELKDKDSVDRELNKILNKKNIQDYINKINESEKDNIVITYDSNDLETKHAENVKSIIDTNINKNNLNEKIESIFIPNLVQKLINNIDKDFSILYDKNFELDLEIDDKIKYENVKKLVNEEIQIDELINLLNENVNNKNIYINKSSANMHGINDFFPLNLDNFLSNEVETHIQECKDRAKKLINSLNQNESIKVSISAGNSFQLKDHNYIHPIFKEKYFDLSDKLKEYIFQITKGDFEQMKLLITNLNFVINNRIENNILNTEIVKDLKEEYKNVDIDDFINLYLRDYILFYDNFEVMKNQEKIINQNIYYIEAYDFYNFFSNYKLYKKYNEPIEELENIFKEFTFNQKFELVGFNTKEINFLKEIYNEYKEKYPSIFKLSTYGNLCNLEFVDNFILQREAHKHNGGKDKILDGTSFASPEFLSSLIVKEINENKLEIKGI